VIRTYAATLPPAPAQGAQDTAEAPGATIQRAAQEAPAILEHLTQEHVRDISSQARSPVEVRKRIVKPAVVLPEGQEGALSEDGADADQLEGALEVTGNDR
jgi:hypothetical protein